MVAKISRYKSSAEIDVQFSDGVIVTNKTYASFKNGAIGHPNTLHKSKIKNRTGECRKMFNGQTATIVRYENAKDIDIKFADGAIRAHCSYKEFKSGHISHPNCTAESLAVHRLGEKKEMNCGFIATITKYNSYHDIEVTFEDGIAVYPIDYGQFSSCSVSHPMVDGNMSLQEAAVVFYLKDLGFEKKPRGSLKDLGLDNFELDLYHHGANVAIEVDGHFHKSNPAIQRDIEKNKKCYHAGITLYRLRDAGLPTLNDGLSHNHVINGSKIYNGLYDCRDIIYSILEQIGIPIPSDDFIDFSRDIGDILQFHSSASVNYQAPKRKGEKVWHKTTRQFMTIIEYKDYHHVTVQFDDGEIAHNKHYSSFKKGEIKHPKQTPNAKKHSRLGESRMMNCGSEATIVEYRNADDIDIVFEDGSIRQGVTYFNFQRGTIAKSKR